MSNNEERVKFLLELIRDLSDNIKTDYVKPLVSKEYTGHSHEVNTALCKVSMVLQDFTDIRLVQLEKDLRNLLLLVSNSNDITKQINT